MRKLETKCLIALTVAATCFAATAATALIPCPDCGQSVSRRAFMCPRCGCCGEAIGTAAKLIDSKPKPRIPDGIVRADFGRDKCDALPVKMADGLFVVLPLEKVLNIETLVFSFASTNATINYSIPEVAVDQPIIRFPITETNLLFAAATTNICSTLATPSRVDVSKVAGWQPIQPKALKNHGKILLKIKAGEDVKLPPKAHPYYKALAERWSKKGNQP